jgi:opacity protein-like surface antigen
LRQRVADRLVPGTGWVWFECRNGQYGIDHQDRLDAGGGIEAMLWSNWLARIEYRYSDYGTFSYTLFSGVDAIAAETKLHTHTALVGVAYRFGGPFVP